MGLLGKLAGGGFFGLMGLAMAKKKKKKPLPAAASPVAVAATANLGPTIDSTDDFRGAFRDRARSLSAGDEMEERERRRRMREQPDDDD